MNYEFETVKKKRRKRNERNGERDEGFVWWTVKMNKWMNGTKRIHDEDADI